ncbi:hypothetical protein AKO1_015189 [Acrasis kona]|uniref:DNA replication factor Cdt1 C-terminal domain-containing protein n=1 Tax=Acrasis kona TaxID=1008807 RepID=A0AAW2ZGQ6_9EUKA
MKNQPDVKQDAVPPTPIKSRRKLTKPKIDPKPEQPSQPPAQPEGSTTVIKSRRNTKKRPNPVSTDDGEQTNSKDNVTKKRKINDEAPTPTNITPSQLLDYQKDLILQFGAVTTASMALIKRSQELSFDKIRSLTADLLKRDFILNDMRILKSVMPEGFDLYWKNNCINFTQLQKPVDPMDIMELPKSPSKAFSRPSPQQEEQTNTSIQPLIKKNDSIEQQIIQNIGARRKPNSTDRTKLLGQDTNTMSTDEDDQSDQDEILSKETIRKLQESEKRYGMRQIDNEDLNRRYILSSSLETAEIIYNLLYSSTTRSMSIEELHRKLTDHHKKNKPEREIRQHVERLLSLCPEWCRVEHLRSNPKKAIFIMCGQNFDYVRKQIAQQMNPK